MTIYVTINGEELQMDGDVSEQWISERIRRRRQAGESIWVRVRIQTNGWGLILASANAPSSGFGGGGGLNESQQRVAALWNERHLNNGSLQPGELIAFLKQLLKMF